MTQSESAPSSSAEQSAEPAGGGLSVGIRRIDAKLNHLREHAPRLLLIGRLIGYVLAIGTVIFVGYRASQGVKLGDLNWWPIAGSLVGFVVYWLCLGRAWSSISGSAMSRTAMATWCRTQVLRYVPGGLLAPAARATSVEGRKRDKLAAVIGENVAMLAVAIALGGVLRALGEKFIYLPLALAAVGPFVLLHLVRGRTTLTNRKIAGAMTWYLIGFAAYAVASVLAQAGVGDTPHAVRIAGAACLAWAVGLVIVFAPGGIGAREAVYVGLLANALPDGVPAAGAVTSRLVMIAAELLVLIVVAGPWWSQWSRRKARAAKE